MEQGFKIPEDYDKVVYLIEKGVEGDRLCEVIAQAQEEMTEDELSSLDRFFDDPDGTKSDMESKPSVDEVENGWKRKSLR